MLQAGLVRRWPRAGATALLLGAIGSLSLAPLACGLDASGLSAESAGSGGASSSGATTTGAGGSSSTSTSTTSSSSSGGGGGGGGAVCGDGVVAPPEQCDDGNTVDGDGCSATCTVDPSICPGLPIALGSSPVTLSGDTTGLADAEMGSCGGDGGQLVYAVTPAASGTLHATLTGAFDKALYARSTCDDVGTELGCDDGTGTTEILVPAVAGVPIYVLVDGDTANAAGAFDLLLELYVCGDGVVQLDEECDDANAANGDGCNACVVVCAGPGTTTKATDTFHCYGKVAAGLSWYDARYACLSAGGDLASITSDPERQLVDAITDSDTWTGGNDQAAEGQYAWANGEPWGYDKWQGGQPDNAGLPPGEDCFLFTATASMHDFPCSDAKSYLCEIEPTGPCGDGKKTGIEECDDGNDVAGDGCSACQMDCGAGEIEDPGTHHCYRFVATAASWSDAEADCASQGAHLASITSGSERAFLAGQGLDGDLWLGGTDAVTEGKWVWADGEVWSYGDWNFTEPNNLFGEDCLLGTPDGMHWNDLSCEELQPYLCERRPAGGP